MVLPASRWSPSGTVCAPAGGFKEFENREMKWYPGEKAELKAIFRGPELPFE